MRDEDRKRSLWHQSESDKAGESFTRRSVAPGKRTLTMSLLSHPASSLASLQAPVQHKADPAAVMQRKEQAALTEQWMDAAFRPDLHDAPVQRKSARREERIHEGAYGDDHDHEPMEANDKIGVKVFKSPRFMGDPTLEKVAAGTTRLKKGASGLAVSRVQSALADAGQAVVRSGTFDDPTVIAVKAFQSSKSIADSGEVDKVTLSALDAVFADHTRDAAIAKGKAPTTKPTEGVEYAHGTAPKELMTGTSVPSTTEATEASNVLAAIQTIDKSTGKKVEFDEHGAKNGKGEYRTNLATLINSVIDAQYAAIAKDKGKAHADPKNLHQLTDVAKAGVASKEKTDAVFGSYATGPAFDATTNLRDRWVIEEKKIKDLETKSAGGGVAGKAADDKLTGIATWRVQKIVNSNRQVATLNGEYGAIVNRDPEKGIIKNVIEDIAGKRGPELREIHKGWPGAANPDTREVFMQLFKSADASEDRKFMWQSFQTLVHEYIHTLNHSRYRNYSAKLSKTDSARGHTLREGVTEYLTKTVLSTVSYGDAALRRQVEGPYHDPGTVETPPVYRGYAQAVEAEQVVGVVGASNMFAAYFLGEIELIGGKP
jgi:peptidoglycan hydrolase-like protein with peptidoglycan-binding domain